MTEDREDEKRTMMFNPLEAEEFRRKMAQEAEKAKRPQATPAMPPADEEGGAKTMMFAPGQIGDELKRQTQNLRNAQTAPAPAPAAAQAELPDDGRGAVTQVFTAADVKNQLDQVLRMRERGETGLPPMPKPTMPAPRQQPAAATPPEQTMAYSPEQAKKMASPAAGDDLGTAQTMMYSVEQSAQLREAMEAAEQQAQVQDPSAVNAAYEMLRQARMQDGVQEPANPFDDANEPVPESPFPAQGFNPTPAMGYQGFTPPAGPSMPQPGFDGGFQPQQMGYPQYQGSSTQEFDSDEVNSSGKGLKIALIAGGVVVAGIIAAVLLHGFGVINLPLDFLPKF